MTHFRKFTAAAVLASLVAGAALPAAAAGVDAATQEQLRTKLTQEGYEVRKIGTEDGLIEVYAMKDGKKFELYFNDKLEQVKNGASEN